jgi:hypothetical protein
VWTPFDDSRTIRSTPRRPDLAKRNGDPAMWVQVTRLSNDHLS